MRGGRTTNLFYNWDIYRTFYWKGTNACYDECNPPYRPDTNSVNFSLPPYIFRHEKIVNLPPFVFLVGLYKPSKLSLCHGANDKPHSQPV